MEPLKNISSQVRYSEKGREITRSLLEGAEPATHNDTALLSCLEQIQASPETTADEKLLAGIALRLNDKITPSDRQAARLCVINAINSAVPGPLGPVFAGVLVKTGDSIGELWERNLVRIDAFKSLSQHTEAAPDVKIFADFVAKRISIGAQSVNIVDRAYQAALKVLAAPLSGPVQALCVNYILEQEKPVAGLAYGESMLHAGLRHFYDNPATPPGRHSLSKSGLLLPNMDIDNDDNIDQIRRSYLRALAHEESDYLPSSVARETLLNLDDLDKTEGKNYVLEHVFQALGVNPDSTQLHKILARGGESLSSLEPSGERLLENQKAVMEAIASLPEKPSRDQFLDVVREIRRRVDEPLSTLDQLFSAEILSRDNDAGTVIINDDDFICIDGLRLDRNPDTSKLEKAYSHLAGRRHGKKRPVNLRRRRDIPGEKLK